MGRNPSLPAMGSHGGATAEGQLKVLARYGVTPESMAVPILSSMDTVEIGRMPWGFPVYVDKHASQADHIVLVNRIKPHTNYRAHVESGLMKMLVIGLGKHQGAIVAHRASVDVGLPRAIPEVARFSLSKLPILFGLGTLENVRHQTAKIEAVLPEALEETEARLLAEAWPLLGRIPFDFLHLLIVDEMGKEISGTGMDPNVLGRLYFFPEEPKSPRHPHLGARSRRGDRGNAVGMGRPISTPARQQVNFNYCLRPHGLAHAGKIPIIFETDPDAIEGARTIGSPSRPTPRWPASRIRWIWNTSTRPMPCCPRSRNAATWRS
jgi:hypothetical protein